MAFSREPMIGSTSRSTTRRVYNPYASGTSTPQTYVKPKTYTKSYVNPYEEAAAAQQDPLAQAITGGSMGGGFDDTVTPTGINTNASGAFQEQTQGKTASGGAVPFNQPPPPPPPAPFNPYASGTSTPQLAPQPSVNNVLPQGSMTSDQHQQVLRMNNQPTGNAYDPNAGNAMALAQTAQRPANQPFNDTVTPTGRSTEVTTSAPRDLPTMAEAQAAQVRQPSMTADDYRNILRGEIAGISSNTMTPEDYNRLLSGESDRIIEATTAGRMSPEDYQRILRGETQGIRDAIVTVDDYNRLLSGQGDRIVEAINASRMSPEDYAAILRGETQGIRESIMTAEDYQNILRGETQGIRDAIVTADDYNRLLSGQGDRIVEAINASRMSPEDYAAILRGESRVISDAISGGTDAQRAMFEAQNQRFTDAISGSTAAQQAMFDAQNRGFTDAISGATDAQRQMFDAQNQQLSGISGILEQQLAMQQAQANQQQQAQLDMEAAQRAQNEQQAQLDMQRAQATQATNDRMRELLQGYTGGTSAQRDMMMAQAPTFQQQELLRRAESRLQAPSGATDAQAAMFAAQRPTELPDVTGFRSSYADAAAAQGGGGATPTGYTNPYADAAARQPDTGLRTFSSQPRFSPMRQGVNRPSDTLQQRLEQEYLGRISAADDPILASQIADQQLRQQEAQKGLVEQLSRYGVLRGGGDTAAALTRLAEGNERNRLALEAAAAQRRQGDLRDALAFDQARAQMGLAERGQTLQERRGQEDILNQQLSRQLQQAGVTGQFQGQDTVQAQQLRQQMDLAERGTALQEQLGGETILDRQQGRDIAAAGLTGRFGDTDTLAGRELSLREELARSGDLRAQQAAESALFGRVITGTDAPVTTLEGQRTLSDLDTAGLAREATEAGLTGAFRGGATTAERALESQLASEDLARQLQEAGVTGQYGGEDTLQSQVIESSLQNEALNRALSRAGATGLFREEGDTGAGTETLESRLRTAGLLGQLSGVDAEGNRVTAPTLAGQQADMDRIAAAIAAVDSDLGPNSLANLSQYLLDNITDPALAQSIFSDLTDTGISVPDIEERYGSKVIDRVQGKDGTATLTLADGSTVMVDRRGTETYVGPDGERKVRPGRSGR